MLACGSSSSAFEIPASEVGLGEAVLYEGETGPHVWVLHGEDGFTAFNAAPPRPNCERYLEFVGEWVDGAWMSDGLGGLFRDPCSGSRFDLSGVLIVGPALRDMDRYPVEVRGATLVIDLDGVERGHCYEADCSVLD